MTTKTTFFLTMLMFGLINDIYSQHLRVESFNGCWEITNVIKLTPTETNISIEEKNEITQFKQSNIGVKFSIEKETINVINRNSVLFDYNNTKLVSIANYKVDCSDDIRLLYKYYGDELNFEEKVGKDFLNILGIQEKNYIQIINSDCSIPPDASLRFIVKNKDELYIYDYLFAYKINRYACDKE